MTRPNGLSAKEGLNNTKINEKEITVADAPLDAFLFVGNLSDDVSNADLRKLGESHGVVERAFVRLLLPNVFVNDLIILQIQSDIKE